MTYDRKMMEEVKKIKALYVCKRCGVTLGCVNIFTKDDIEACEFCRVSGKCDMQKATIKYINLYEIRDNGFCNGCYNPGHA